MGKFIDLSGQIFGRWKVISIAYTKYGHHFYNCECQCENHTIKVVDGCHLKSGASKSCGCLRKEISHIKNGKDITGQKFGKLLVIEPAGVKNGHLAWKCKCDCGNEKIVIGRSLRLGYTQSCGCTKSFGEEKIIKILTENNIKFETQKDFENCRYPDTNFKAKFDFFIDNSYLLEYDGKQHYGLGGWNDEENFKIIQNHDEFKNKWCLINNIPLIRIPYKALKNLTLKDILLQTSSYRVK